MSTSGELVRCTSSRKTVRAGRPRTGRATAGAAAAAAAMAGTAAAAAAPGAAAARRSTPPVSLAAASMSPWARVVTIMPWSTKYLRATRWMSAGPTRS
jgi:hypothetical protein